MRPPVADRARLLASVSAANPTTPNPMIDPIVYITASNRYQIADSEGNVTPVCNTETEALDQYTAMIMSDLEASR